MVMCPDGLCYGLVGKSLICLLSIPSRASEVKEVISSSSASKDQHFSTVNLQAD